MLSEQKEKDKRKFNLILHNVKESNDSVAANRKKHDIDSAIEIFQHYNGIPASINSAIPIGKKVADKTRLLKLTLSSEDVKVKILRNCIKLRNKDHPDNIRKVFITPDQTPQEQERNRKLRVELATMNATSNDYKIKTAKSCGGIHNSPHITS